MTLSNEWYNTELENSELETLHRSPLFSGAIEGTGPRYCPSIEDKMYSIRCITVFQDLRMPRS